MPKLTDDQKIVIQKISNELNKWIIDKCMFILYNSK
jgi:hypothetical protein